MLKNEGFFWKVKLGIQKDVASTLVAIQTELTRRRWRAPAQFLESLKERELEKEETNAEKANLELLDGKLNPLNLLSRLEKVRDFGLVVYSSNVERLVLKVGVRIHKRAKLT